MSLTVADILGRGLIKVPERLDICEFTERYRILPRQTSAMAGPIVLARTPYAAPILRASQERTTKVLTVVMASQTGKTTTLESIALYTLIDRGVPGMWVLPEAKSRNAWLSQRFKPSILQSERFQAELMPGKQSITNSMVKFAGAPLYLALSDSESDLASRSVGLVVLDEIDKFPGETANEGSPIDQARKRVRTFPRPLVLQSSTPTSESGAIWQQFLSSSREWWMIACPSCGTRQRWSINDCRAGDPLEGMTGEQHIRAVAMGDIPAWWECPSCKRRVSQQAEKDLINQGGIFVADMPGGDHRGFQVPALASPFWSIRQHVTEYLKAKAALELGDHSKMLDFYIHQEGLPWQPPGKKVELQSVEGAISDLPAALFPAWVEFITIGMDVQGDGVWFLVAGWSPRQNRVHLGYWGFSTDHPSRGMGEIERMLAKEWEREDGRKARADFAAMDSGDGNSTEDVYRFCNRFERLFPVKGASGRLSKSYQISRGQEHKDKLRIVDTHKMKDMISNLFANSRVTMARPAADDIEFLRMLVSEERNKETGMWEKRKGYKANHILDTFAYNLAIAADLFFGHAGGEDAPQPKKKTQPKIVGRYQP